MRLVVLVSLALASAAHSSPTFVVGTPSGLFVIGLDGVRVKKISATEAGPADCRAA